MRNPGSLALSFLCAGLRRRPCDRTSGPEVGSFLNTPALVPSLQPLISSGPRCIVAAQHQPLRPLAAPAVSHLASDTALAAVKLVGGEVNKSMQGTIWQSHQIAGSQSQSGTLLPHRFSMSRWGLCGHKAPSFAFYMTPTPYILLALPPSPTSCQASEPSN